MASASSDNVNVKLFNHLEVEGKKKCASLLLKSLNYSNSNESLLCGKHTILTQRKYVTDSFALVCHVKVENEHYIQSSV